MFSSLDRLEARRIRPAQVARVGIFALSDYSNSPAVCHDFIINYSNLDMEAFERALDILSERI